MNSNFSIDLFIDERWKCGTKVKSSSKFSCFGESSLTSETETRRETKDRSEEDSPDKL